MLLMGMGEVGLSEAFNSLLSPVTMNNDQREGREGGGVKLSRGEEEDICWSCIGGIYGV